MEEIKIGSASYVFNSLNLGRFEQSYKNLPCSLKVLIENLFLYSSSKTDLFEETLDCIINSQSSLHLRKDILFQPARVLMQDFTGVPAVVDLAAMRDFVKKNGGEPEKINPIIPVDLVIDHSVTVDFNREEAIQKNVNLEYKRNLERYKFLKWAQESFSNFRVIPPGVGICHQVNLEYLAKVVCTKKLENGSNLAYFDTVIGTDSHTTMVNALGVLGWGVGGIEAEAAMLGQPLSLLIPQVVGVHLKGKLNKAATATDLVLSITHALRQKGVVGKFVEFFGDALNYLSLADRATIANMAPEYGATCGFFPIDHETLKYLKLTGRHDNNIKLVEAYSQYCGLWRNHLTPPKFSEVLEIDLQSVSSLLAGPKRPQDKLSLNELKQTSQLLSNNSNEHKVENHNFKIRNNDVVIAAITSCTNKSNPYVMIAAGLVAKKARKFGLKAKPLVKTSLAPGSQVVFKYLKESCLIDDLNSIGFYLVGYGCTTCIGNSGPLNSHIVETIHENNLTVSSVLSGNRNFEGRINPHVKANYLASPPLVVAFAIAGTTNINLTYDPIDVTSEGKKIYLEDLWPSTEEINTIISKFITPSIFQEKYKNIFEGDAEWKTIKVHKSSTYQWEKSSTYIKKPTYIKNFQCKKNFSFTHARILALFGDSLTTDHISPAGSIKKDSPAGSYLEKNNVKFKDFNSYGARRGNHEVMTRGTFANIRIKNEMLEDITGGITYHFDNKNKSTLMSIYDAAMLYQHENKPLVIIAGKEYGTGSSRDWAAKGTALLGIKCVIAESFERIHRSNLIGMGVLPLQFQNGESRLSLNLKGNELVSIKAPQTLTPNCNIESEFLFPETKNIKSANLLCCVNTKEELEYMKANGVLSFILNNQFEN